MNSSYERNLDSQARRLADIDAAMNVALGDDPIPARLPESVDGQNYDQLTAFNDGLRAQFDWAEVDLDRALTSEQREALAAWSARQRVPWSGTDLATVGVAGLVGCLCVWLDSEIDAVVRKRFEEFSKTDRVRGWEKAGKRLPIDFMGTGFGGRNHRVKSAGHDLSRVIEALRQIMDGEFRGLRRQFGEQIPVVREGFRDVSSWSEAATLLMKHLAADFLTPMSLPIPGSSRLWESESDVLAQFASHTYSGMRAGQGWNLRNAAVGPSMTAVITEVIVRTHVHAESWELTGSAKLDPPQLRKRTELLLAAHALVGAASLGKATASMLLTQHERGVLHPSAVKHVHLPSLLRAGSLAVTVVKDFRSTAGVEVKSWDDLINDTESRWRQELESSLEVASERGRQRGR